MSPAVPPAGLRQPDPRSCGAACAVVAAGPPWDPATFGARTLETHRRLTRARMRGRPQVPWPRALGTPPWALARELSALTGVRHRTRVVRWSRHLPAGPGVLVVGDRWLPRHVALLLDQPARSDGRVACYEPASGRVVALDLDALARREARVGQWRQAWFRIVPAR